MLRNNTKPSVYLDKKLSACKYTYHKIDFHIITLTFSAFNFHKSYIIRYAIHTLFIQKLDTSFAHSLSLTLGADQRFRKL